MTRTIIKGIAWDFGNILARFDHLKACRKLAEHSTYSPDEILAALFSASGAPAKLHETGRLTSEGFFLAAQEAAHLTGDLSFQAFSAIWKDIFQENAGIGAIIEKIRPDVKQCILSNTDPIHWSAIERLPVMQEHFSRPDLLVRSYTSGARKPDEKIYRDMLRCLSLTGQNIRHILYIDDIAEYRDAFARMGGNVLAYDCSKDPLEQLEAGLKKFDVLLA